MSKLEIYLNDTHKSFEKGFATTLEGKLVILSGVNGAGKSQLMSIIRGIYTNPIQNTIQNISSNIKIDDIILKKEEIDFRSFKENISISEITPSTSQTFLQSTNQAWHNYQRHLLNPVNQELSNFSDSCIEAKNILVKNFSESEFNNRSIKEAVFKATLQNSNYIWKQGDKFTNIIGEIFFLHILKVNKKMVEVGRSHFTLNMLEEAPWLKLNKLFAKLKLDYRFKENYELNGVEINEQPKLFAIKSDGLIDENSSRNLVDLSDGEKTIIALCFATLIDNNKNKKKLLLLDELDSVLNPSLIQMFFAVIQEFFIDEGIMVVLSTHSPSTISLSPDYTKFYEIFKPNTTGNRILEIPQNNYSELLIANKKFYDKISNQEKRITELQNNIISNQNILIITEGKTDWKYFLSALRFFHERNEFEDIEEDFFYRFGSEQDKKDNVCHTREVNELSDSKLKNYLNSLIEARKIDVDNNQIRIGIFDSDTNIQLVNDSLRNVFSFKIEPNNISTELLFTDEEIKFEINDKRLFIGDEFDSRSKIHKTNPLLTLGGDSSNTNKAGKRTIIESDVYNRKSENVSLSKEKFAQAIYHNSAFVSLESWNNFKDIFEKISRIIPKKMQKGDDDKL